jgi:voltage-gated potassium channel
MDSCTFPETRPTRPCSGRPASSAPGGLICAVDSDAANVYITLTARGLNPDLRIVARAFERASIDKLMRAGADEVVTPYGLTGRRMAVLAVQPSVLEVLDLLNLGSDIRLEEVAVQAGTHLDSLTIAEARARCAGVALTEQQWMRFIVDGPPR